MWSEAPLLFFIVRRWLPPRLKSQLDTSGHVENISCRKTPDFRAIEILIIYALDLLMESGRIILSRSPAQIAPVYLGFQFLRGC